MSDPHARRRQLAAAVNWRGLAEFLGRSLEDIEAEDGEEEREPPEGEKPKTESRAAPAEL